MFHIMHACGKIGIYNDEDPLKPSAEQHRASIRVLALLLHFRSFRFRDIRLMFKLLQLFVVHFAHEGKFY